MKVATKIAMPYWHNRISPVLDTAENFLVVDVQDGRRVKNVKINLGDKSLSDRVEYFKKYQVKVLLCGAISDYYHNLISAAGIRIIPWLRGDIDRILEAFIYNGLLESEYIMPGCRGHSYRKRYRRRGLKKE